jgi:hypothetical protein
MIINSQYTIHTNFTYCICLTLLKAASKHGGHDF